MANLPSWFGGTMIRYTHAVEDGIDVIRLPGGDKPVKWRADCPGCVKMPDTTDFWPDHQAMAGCRSGGRNHCTCDGCF